MTVEEISRDYKWFLYAKAYRLTNEKSIAEEYVATAIARMCEHRDTIENHENWKGYATLILNRLHIDRHRMHTSRFISVPEVFDSEESKFYFTEEGKDELEFIKLVEEISKDLPDIQKEPFVLQAKGYKYQEIADILGENIGTIKTRIFHARRKLEKNKLLLELIKNR